MSCFENSVNSDKLASDQDSNFFKQVLITVIMQLSWRQKIGMSVVYKIFDRIRVSIWTSTREFGPLAEYRLSRC